MKWGSLLSLKGTYFMMVLVFVEYINFDLKRIKVFDLLL